MRIPQGARQQDKVRFWDPHHREQVGPGCWRVSVSGVGCHSAAQPCPPLTVPKVRRDPTSRPTPGKGKDEEELAETLRAGERRGEKEKHKEGQRARGERETSMRWK